MAKRPARNGTTSVFFAGIGGQGVLLASEIVAQVAGRAGLDVKKSEVHGMSQRGGSVVTIVRFGRKVHSPLVRQGAADVLVAFEPTEGRRHAAMLARDGARVDSSGALDVGLPDPRTANMFILGKLAARLPFARQRWLDAIAERVPPRTIEPNSRAFTLGWEYREGK
ncbi:MAG: indolepyruvate oxidoreductase subunit beta [Verrucomicrobia bacterium]|nr:indolepyruvate oxidoreductase subunit beta [Verrucomicrobiota bacterium]